MCPMQYSIAQNFNGEILTDTGSSNIQWKMTEDGHCLSPCTCKHCNAFINSDSVNVGHLAGNSENIKIMHCTVCR